MMALTVAIMDIMDLTVVFMDHIMIKSVRNNKTCRRDMFTIVNTFGLKFISLVYQTRSINI